MVPSIFFVYEGLSLKGQDFEKKSLGEKVPHTVLISRSCLFKIIKIMFHLNWTQSNARNILGSKLLSFIIKYKCFFLSDIL